ncbi:hypothetical protein [Rhizobium sp. PL01]|jgi:hypothetical protein|uniref:hypothetical protein n=1 Tax=Rhizobium sp. PL01 TaxID=3085631 RepID=UPI0029810D08|nr:hypothetical protein [Rhizobium sp. PL01]MDW5316916.1 hypothetical protein [Rhizobium sp. PL01]
MRKTIQTIGAATIAAIVGLTTFTAASAVPLAPALATASNVELAQYRHHDKGKPDWKRNDRRHDRVDRHEKRRGYWNGHRGYREHRRGYRRHSDGYYYAPEVFKLYIR